MFCRRIQLLLLSTGFLKDKKWKFTKKKWLVMGTNGLCCCHTSTVTLEGGTGVYCGMYVPCIAVLVIYCRQKNTFVKNIWHGICCHVYIERVPHRASTAKWQVTDLLGQGSHHRRGLNGHVVIHCWCQNCPLQR